MKRIQKYIFMMMIAAVLFSCEDFIEEPQRGVQNLDNYFATVEEAESFVNGIYASFYYHNDWWKHWLRLVNEMATDDGWMGNLQQSTADSYPLAHYFVTPSNAPQRMTDFYRLKYESINSCNIAIARIPESPISEEAIKQYTAQAKFFRAFNYFELVQNFGDVVLVTEPKGTSDLNLSRTSSAEIYEQIIRDLEDAAKILPLEYSDGGDVGRVTKGACHALLARTYLFMKDYENAYDYADMVIKSNVYQLEPNFVDIWSVNNHNGMESIFEIQTNPDQTYNVGNVFATVMNGRGEIWPDGQEDAKMDGWGWGVPTSNLEQAFKSEGDSIRLKSTINRLGMPVYGDEEDNPEYRFDPDLNKSCRTVRKYYIPVAVRKELTKRYAHLPLNIIMIRLAEMYLTRAEAAYFLKNESQALSDINTLRERVELDPKTGLSGNDLLYAIWKERRLELAWEGMRLYDLRRQVDPVSGKPRIDEVMGPNGSFVKYNLEESTDHWELIHVEERQDKGIQFIEGRHELWPIPQAEIDRSNGAIEQNPGY